ncbi:MAG TPA: YceI family protein [Flavobacteriaceae bacterium]|nr:YceI family protein [Flavobacteriaceae bacterium]
MKTTLSTLALLTFFSLAVVSCKNKANEAVTSEAEAAAVSEPTSEKYIADVSASVIEWKGFKPTATHHGTVKLDTGTFQITDGNIQSGTFLIDMKTITDLDLEGDMKNNLEAHLMGTVEGKEGDFFNVNLFPTGAFEVTGTEAIADGKINLSGNLTLKGIKHNVTFPATVTREGDTVTLTSDSFTIDRTKWGVNFGSKTVFDNLGDKFVNDEIELKITVVAHKKA